MISQWYWAHLPIHFISKYIVYFLVKRNLPSLNKNKEETHNKIFVKTIPFGE